MTSFDPEKITFFAKTDARGQEKTFGIKAKDRQRHMYIVGKTGMGKSTLLENMAAQDMQNGEGMAFIDPHGSAAETLLDYVPEHRIDDVVYFAPFDLNHPVSFNVMEDVGPDKRHLVVSGLMSTFKKIWVDAWSARMEYILTNALLALIEYPDTTLLSVNRLFIDKAYRDRVVDYVKDPAVKAYWTEEFANYTERFAAEALPAIQNKIGQFTGNPLIRNIIGQPHSSFNIREIMDQKKILIMNLSKGLIGETNANLLGSMLTTRIYLAAMSRADLPVEEMRVQPNFYFYVDEFQSFANSTFANILSEARKYHLNLIIAHQYIAQMEEEVRDAVFGNVGTTISFRVGPFDGEVLETVFAPQFTATDLVNLGFAQIYLTLMIDGIGSQPFSATTLPPVQRPPKSSRNQVVVRSRELYSSDRETVEKIVDELHMPDIDNESNKKNNKSKGKSNTGKKKEFQNKKVNKGPQTSEELKAVLAKVAEENGGAKKDKDDENNNVSERDTDNKADDSYEEGTDTTLENEKLKERIKYETGLQSELARFKALEENQQKETEQKRLQESKQNNTEEQTKESKSEKGETNKKDSSRSVQSAREKKEHSQDLDNQTEKNKESNKSTESADSANSKQIDNSDSDKSTKATHSFIAVERFRDVEESNKNKKQSEKTHKHSHSKNNKSKKNGQQNNSRYQLKEALAEVLKETERKEAYKVPAFVSVEDSVEKGRPTVRVVKPITDETQSPPSASAPSAPKLTTDDPLDPRKIKNMLQTSKHEKSPMNPPKFHS